MKLILWEFYWGCSHSTSFYGVPINLLLDRFTSRVVSECCTLHFGFRSIYWFWSGISFTSNSKKIIIDTGGPPIGYFNDLIA